MIGSIAVIASVVRIHALWVYFNSGDPGYDAIKVRKHHASLQITKQTADHQTLGPPLGPNRNQRRHRLRLSSVSPAFIPVRLRQLEISVPIRRTAVPEQPQLWAGLVAFWRHY